MMTTSEMSANGRGASFPGIGVSGNQDIEKWRTHRRAKLVHKPSATWSQNVGIAKGRGQPGVTCPKTAKLAKRADRVVRPDSNKESRLRNDLPLAPGSSGCSEWPCSDFGGALRWLCRTSTCAGNRD